MSRNRKYIERFDQKAGKPSDFDSLFRFEKGELIANRRIKPRHTGRQIAAMCTAAALIGGCAFVWLVDLNTQGLASVSDAGDETSLTAGAAYEVTTAHYVYPEKLSELISPFDHTAAQQQRGAAARIMSAAEPIPSAIMRFRVVQKEYLSDDRGDSYLTYEVCPLEHYTFSDEGMYFGGNVTVSAYANGDIREMQEGCEYIAPLYTEESDAYGWGWVLRSDEEPVRHTDAGWLIGSRGEGVSFNTALSGGTERVENDVDHLNDYYLERSDEALEEKIEDYIRGLGVGYSRSVNADDGADAYTLESILPGTEFESVRYGDKSDGSTDTTLLVLDNQVYFTFSPQFTGTVVYAGGASDGRQMTVIRLEGKSAEEGYARTMLVTGFESLNVRAGDRPDAGKVIGECGKEPLYMRFINGRGEPVEIDLNSDTSAVMTTFITD